MATKLNEKSPLSKAIITSILFIVALLCIIPMLYVFSISLSSEPLIFKYGYKLIPKQMSLTAYGLVFKQPGQILNAYKISIIVTLCGTFFGLLFSSMVAYSTVRKEFKYRNAVSFYIFFTMMFNGGLVPWYMVVTRGLRLQDSILALILPYLIIPVHVLFLKGYFSTIPNEIYESTRIDGCGEMATFFKIALPLAKPGLATVGLLYCLIYWNDWFLALMFIDDVGKLPVQSILYRIMMNVEFLAKNLSNMAGTGIEIKNLPTETTRMAVMVVAAGPMMLVFPFFQRFFIKGLTVGAVKG